MPIMDIDQIINGTPQKVLMNQYHLMRENYNETTAKDFKQAYENQPLSFLLENSRYIFAEPYFGYDYYKEAVTNTGYCDFLALERELDKLSIYLEENGAKLPEKQKEMYVTLQEEVASILHGTEHLRYIMEAMEEKEAGITKKLSDAIFAKNVEAFEQAIGSDDALYHAVIESYLPYIASDDTEFAAAISEKFLSDIESETDITESEDIFKRYAIRTVCGNVASQDELYKTESIHNRDLRTIVEFVANESLAADLEKIRTTGEKPVIFANPQTAVNNIFTDIMEASVLSEEFALEKEKYEKLYQIACEATLTIAQNDITVRNESEKPYVNAAYTLFPAEETVSDVMEKAFRGSDFFVEAGDLVEESDNKVALQKPEKPDLPTRIQNKAIDMEVEQNRKFGEIKANVTKVGNAVKAVTRLPMNIVNSIKDIAHKIDDADDERRKQYMTEPGFRKKIYRNMKLSLMYGAALSTRLTLFPLLLVVRHASKMKDKRIRNECYRELRTEIKICEEKINDANAAGDNKEKYRLMRIKDQLDAEAIRVRYNSKVI